MEIVTWRLLLSHISGAAKSFKLLYLNHAWLSHVIKEFLRWIVQVERRSRAHFLARCPAGWGKSIEDLTQISAPCFKRSSIRWILAKSSIGLPLRANKLAS